MASGKTHDLLAITTTVGALYYILTAHLISDLNCISIFAIASLSSAPFVFFSGREPRSASLPLSYRYCLHLG